MLYKVTSTYGNMQLNRKHLYLELEKEEGESRMVAKIWEEKKSSFYYANGT